jgi:anti-sigma factor RsiW
MNRKRPQTEEAWTELLSAYLDGELEADERRALESWLAEEPARARQMEELRRVGGLLQEWTVEAPEPDPALVRALIAPPARRRRPEAGKWGAAMFWFLRVPGLAHAAIFLLGMLVGIGAMQARQRTHEISLAPARAEAPAQTPERESQVAALAGPGESIPPGQADRIWREVQAGNLKNRVMTRMNQGDFREAVKAWRELNEKYPDSGALRQLRERPAVRQLAQQLGSRGRI